MMGDAFVFSVMPSEARHLGVTLCRGVHFVQPLCVYLRSSAAYGSLNVPAA
jgi:hypothetical protein